MRQSQTNKQVRTWVRFIVCIPLFYFSIHACAAEELAPVIRVTNTIPGMRIHPGFRVEIVANDSEVAAPAALAFDENGKLFVAEMRDYPERRDQSPHLGRIRLLQDTDGDGIFESSTVFADDISMPSAVACYNGGIFVAATPEILYLKDANGDGVADERKVVFSGFGSNSSSLRSDFALNNFVWGLDNRIHGGASGIGGAISGDGTGSEPITLGQNDFSFDPRTLTLSPEAGSAQSGLTFDNQGRKFFCDFTHPLRQALFEPGYFTRNPYFVAAQDSAENVSPMAQIFRLTSPGQTAVSNPRATGRTAPTSPIQSPALFTRACGCVIYRGNAFASNFVGNAFIADPNAHCIHHIVLRENGLAISASRAPDEQSTEFLGSSDPSFHPFQIVNGPDGALYVADFLDGGDSGRILRIVPDNFKQPKIPRFGSAKTYDLVATLASADGWHRDTAARLLCEKRDPSAVGLLTNMANNARNPLARLHALATLHVLGGFTEPVALKSLRDSDPAVRRRAVLLSENLVVDGLISEPLWNQLRFMADDNSPAVRYQVALSLGQIRHAGRPQLLAGMLQRAGGDIWMQNAIFSSLHEGAAECFVMLANDGGTRNNPAGVDLLRRLALMIGTQGSLDEVSQAIDWLDRNGSDPHQRNAYVLAAGLGEGLRRTGSSLGLVDPQHRLERVYGQAVSMSVDYNTADPLRLDAIRLLGVNYYPLTDVGNWFLLLVDGNQSPAIKSAGIETLCSYSDSRVVTGIMARWSAFSPALRKLAVSAFLTRVERLDTVLSEIESGRIQPEEVSPAEVNLLRTYSDQSIRQRATRIFGPLTPQHPAAVENFRSTFRLIGDANRGREVYRARCANCHRTGDNGPKLGPDLADMRALAKERLLSAIVQPSAELQSKFLTCVIETQNGRLFIGLLHRQNPKTVTLITAANDEIVLPRVNIKTIRPQPWSLMPDGLEQGLTPQAMSDLLQYTLAPVR
jgi:putative membrane-bound dehydrogenase-like protein